jgi:subtilisin family serine protease
MLRLTLTNIFVLLVSIQVNADVGWARFPRNIKQIVIAVIDTGLDSELMSKNFVCKSGHKDFTGGGLVDTHGHGTHISGIIDQYAKDYIFTKGKYPSDIDKLYENYCQIIIKFYDPNVRTSNNLKNTIKAFRWAIDHKVDIINYSGGGPEFSKEEKKVVVEALDKGIKVVAAAGNERSDIDVHKFYPAMYDKRIYIVGNIVGKSREIAASSNYGESVNSWEEGTLVLSRVPVNKYNYMSGTSQATAVKSGKLVREMLLQR